MFQHGSPTLFTVFAHRHLIVLQTGCFAEGVMWQQEVQDKAACKIAKADEMLQPRQPLLAGLRYLSLLYEGRNQDAKGIVAMKRGRKKGEADLEREYYPHMLKIFQVLAANDMSCVFATCVAVPTVALFAVMPVSQNALHPAAGLSMTTCMCRQLQQVSLRFISNWRTLPLQTQLGQIYDAL